MKLSYLIDTDWIIHYLNGNSGIVEKIVHVPPPQADPNDQQPEALRGGGWFEYFIPPLDKTTANLQTAAT